MPPTLTRRGLLKFAAFAATARFSEVMGAGRTWQLGSNTAIEGFGLIEAIRTVREIGFTAIEIHPMGVIEPMPGKFPGFQFDKLDSSVRHQIREALKGFQRVTTHLPYTGLNYMSDSREAREPSIRAVEIAMEATAFFGANLAVLHPQPLPDDSVERMWPEYIRRFRQWGDTARQLKFRIALETGYPRSVHQYLRLIREIDHEAVGATIDVGHQKQYEELVARVKPGQRSSAEGIKAYNDTTNEIALRLGKKLFHLHVHDIDPETWQEHKPFVHNFVDYGRLFATLRKVDYEGVLMFEIGGKGTDQRGYLTDGMRKLNQLMKA